jgi:HK97 family phage major capsid protein
MTKEEIKQKRAELKKKRETATKALEGEALATMQTIFDEIDAFYASLEAENATEALDKLKDKIKELEEKLGAAATPDSVEAVGEEMKKLKTAMAEMRLPAGGTKSKGLGAQIKDFLSTEDFKKGIENKQGQKLSLKAAEVITRANATNAPDLLSTEIVEGIQAKPVEENVVLAALDKGATSSATIKWVNRVDGEGGAAFIAEGELKPLKDWEYQEETSSAKKIAVSAKVSTEMLNDFSYMESEIRELLSEDLMKVVEQKLINGDGGAKEPKGIANGASAYVGTGLDGTVTTPTNADAIRAAMLQMRLLNFKPDVVFMNPTDVAALDLIKTADGHYIKVEIDAIMQNIRVIETTSIAAGNFILMDTVKWKVRVLENLVITFGWENDDFTHNLVTILAEMRLHSYQYGVDAGAVIADTFTNVKGALELNAAA